MSTSTLTVERRRVSLLARGLDYVELTKPRIAIMVLVTVAVSSLVARWGQPDPLVILHALIGTFFTAASASALNQWLERRRDSLMERTADRPLPSGRLSPKEVLAVSLIWIVFGTVYLGMMLNWTTAFLGLLTWFLYVWVYTPLKRRTWLNTMVGAVAGALPVLMGWAATGASLNPLIDVRALALFLVLFLWQFPHFMAIAWIYRKQYEKAGLKMLTVVDPSGKRAGLQAVGCALALLPVSFVPGLLTSGAAVFVAVAFLLGVAQLVCAILFFVSANDTSARRLLRASLIYLPSLLALLVVLPFI
jgi:protoheme IX farnesyltransferase